MVLAATRMKMYVAPEEHQVPGLACAISVLHCDSLCSCLRTYMLLLLVPHTWVSNNTVAFLCGK